MLRRSTVFQRQGKPRAPQWMNQRRRMSPMFHRPYQGGQQHFNRLQLQEANTAAARERREAGNAADVAQALGRSGSAAVGVDLKSPLAQFAENRMARDAEGSDLLRTIAADDRYTSRRGFNELAALNEYQAEAAAPDGLPPTGEEAELDDGADINEGLPPSVTDDAYFKSTFGYSLLKTDKSKFAPPLAAYSRIDLWAEQPKYTRGTYFLYLVARRRNAYAVMYDYDGKRMHQVYSVGNRGLKNSDKGFRQDGSRDNAHVVTSQYINDVLPKVYEREIAEGRMKPGENKKIEVVVRVLGFYNGRAGAIRAVKDREDALDVKFVEDITPFPLNGPRMPKVSRSV